MIVDCEHGNISDSEMHDSVTAVAASGSSPIVRIRGLDAGLIKRSLDSGAQYVLPLAFMFALGHTDHQWSYDTDDQ